MDSFQFNKIAGAVLAALLVVVGSGFLIDSIFDDHAPEKPGYKVDIKAHSGGGHGGDSKADAPAEKLDFASGDVAKGENITKKCKACHSFDKGGPNKVGPNLYGVVGRPLAAAEGYKYSKALTAKGGDWTLEMLNCFLTKPSKCVKGTTMGFAGLKKPADRVNLIAYLKSLGG